ncbi:hypothetical protein BH24ACT4_BH24ACT4_06030 [soil metagenome]
MRRAVSCRSRSWPPTEPLWVTTPTAAMVNSSDAAARPASFRRSVVSLGPGLAPLRPVTTATAQAAAQHTRPTATTPTRIFPNGFSASSPNAPVVLAFSPPVEPLTASCTAMTPNRKYTIPRATRPARASPSVQSDWSVPLVVVVVMVRSPVGAPNPLGAPRRYPARPRPTSSPLTAST